MSDILQVARDALEAAADKILNDYRTWIADDTKAKPRYGQIPAYDAVNAAVGEIDRHLRLSTATPADVVGLADELRSFAANSLMDRTVEALLSLSAKCGELERALEEIRAHMIVERTEDGRIAGIGHDSQALPKIVAILDAALSRRAGG